MNRPERWRSNTIKSPADGLRELLNRMYEDAVASGEEKEFVEDWTGTPKMAWAFRTLIDYDPRYDHAVRESDYHIISHGNKKEDEDDEEFFEDDLEDSAEVE